MTILGRKAGVRHGGNWNLGRWELPEIQLQCPVSEIEVAVSYKINPSMEREVNYQTVAGHLFVQGARGFTEAEGGLATSTLHVGT